MVEHVSGFEAAELITAEDEPAPDRPAARLTELVGRRVAGEPLQYVLGGWLFRGLDLLVDPRVVIPRPETEVTAQVAIDEAVRLGARRGRSDPWSGAATAYAIADLGTGSGALALALASELPDAEVWGTDVTDDALAVARANLAGTGLPSTRVRLARGSWFDALPAALRGHVRLVVSNPPYLAAADDLDGTALLQRYRERAEAVKDRPLPPVAGAERQRFIEQAELDYMDFAIVADATWTFEDGILKLQVDLRPQDS